ncbi:MAG: hypothetical protein MUE79_05640 [Nitratireductor sp.]|jgi:hypothetical protein|nr:hypothetical protein [Nitratireductor sp.]
MSEKALQALAFLLLCAFLGILLFKLPRLDLIALVTLTLALAFYDLFFFKKAGS